MAYNVFMYIWNFLKDSRHPSTETFLLAAQAKRLILFVDATLWRAIKQEDEFYIPESNALFVYHNSQWNGEAPPAAATF